MEQFQLKGSYSKVGEDEVWQSTATEVISLCNGLSAYPSTVGEGIPSAIRGKNVRRRHVDHSPRNAEE